MNIKIQNLDKNNECKIINTNGVKMVDCFFEEETTIFFPNEIAKEVAEYYTESLEQDPYNKWDIYEDIINYFLNYEQSILDKVTELIIEYGNKVEE